MSPPTETIRQKIMLPAAPGVVHDILTDPARLSEITGQAADGKAGVGRRMTAGDGRIFILFLELDGNRSMVQEWSTSKWPAGVPPSRVEITMRPIGQGTDLRLVQSGVPAEMLDEIEREWYDIFWNPIFEHLRSRALY
jgi:activator of HSP90 ATPase